MRPQLIVVGLGPGDPELVTVKAAKILSEADVVFVPYSTSTGRSLARRVVDKYVTKARIVELGFPMISNVSVEALKRIVDKVCGELSNAVLGAFAVLGDPTLYSTFARIRNLIDCADVTYVPGVSSVTACAARLGMDLAIGDDAVAIVPSSRPDLIEAINGLFETVVVLKGGRLDEAARALRGYDIRYARRCYMDGETLTT